jgi:hypothetical protein
MTDSPEARFLVRCARERDALGPRELEAAAAAVVDWGRVIVLAAHHGVTAHARRALLEYETDVGADVHQRLKDNEVADVAGVLLLDVALKRTLEALERRDIGAIVLKGPVLARRLYDSAAFRPYHDVDIVVHAEQLDLASRTVLELGFIEIPYEAEVARAAFESSGAEEPFHRMFVSTKQRALVEVHADPLQLGLKPKVEDDRWERAVPTPALGPGALALSDEDQLVQLCVHAHKHGFSRLIWLKDLDLFVRRLGAALDWRSVDDVSRREGVRSSIWYALSLATELLGTPPTPAERMAPAAPVRALYERIWPRRVVADLDAEMRRRAVQFHVAESWRGMFPTVVLMGRRTDRLRLIWRAWRASLSRGRPS